MTSPILTVTDLNKTFVLRRSLWGTPIDELQAVRNVNLQISAGQTFALVGESGSGKSTAAYCILQLLKATSGSVNFLGNELTQMTRKEILPLRQEMQVIFQDPYSSLNPRMTVGRMLQEPLDIHKVGSKASRQKRVDELLDLVGFANRFKDRYPHEFSGGQRQRIGIARAIALNPKLIVCDEPVSALDVSIQAQILNLLKDIQDATGVSYLFIAHDLAVVYHMADEIGVISKGEIVEQGKPQQIYQNPQHEYTQQLLASAVTL